MSDDHASAAISSYGSKIIKTPNIDRIAQNGMRFTNAFVVSSLCAPSRAAILNGQYGGKSGFKRIGDVFDGSQQTLPKLLQKGGYKTAIFGKWHLRSEPTGFDYYEIVRGQGNYFDPRFFTNEDQWKDEKKGGTISKGYHANIITDKSMQWMEQREKDSPFALFVHYKVPHAPHVTPGKYDSLFTRNLPKPDTFYDSFEDNNSFIKNSDYQWSKLEYISDFDVRNSRNYNGPPNGIERGTQAFKEWAYQTMYKGYYRQLASLDDNVGRLLDYLEASGIDENTIIVYTSDNGWFLGDHGLFNKMWMYEESFKIPLIISYPDHISENTVEDRIVSTLDFAPTFLDYAGVEIPSSMQGRSLKPILEGEKPETWRTSFFYHYYDQFGVPEHYGVRTHDFKLIKFFDSTRTEYELYDLSDDPKEINNVFDELEYEQIQDSLMEQLEYQRKKFEN